MKHFYLCFLLVLFSCKENKMNDKETLNLNEKSLETIVEYEDDPLTFKEEFNRLPLKKTPIIENISINNKPQNLNVFTFKLDEIFENWFKKAYGYQLVSGYRLNLSKEFYTAILKIRIGKTDQEHRLINYDLEGKVITSTRVATFSYGELEYSTSKSKINRTEIIITDQFVVKDSDYKKEKQTTIKILPNGNLKELSENELICDLVAEKLSIDNFKRIKYLETFKQQPNNSEEAIVVIPEIVKGSEDEGFLVLNTHIAIVDLKAKSITHKYFESHKTNGWVSDAIRLDEIMIDSASYFVKENTRAFGIRVKFIGMSRVNPYLNETLSLFVKEKNQLKNILHNYSVELDTGEWNGNCEGEFNNEKKLLILAKNKTHDFFDISVKNTITNTTNFIKENGDCYYNEKIKREINVLKFDGNQYK